MGWQEQYRQASFRKVEFFVNRAERTGGRRVVINELPKRDEPNTEDMGRRANGFTVEGYLLGDDFYEQKEDLITALEKVNSGKLVHPYYGILNVNCTAYRITDTTSETRMCRITMDFVEAGPADTPAPAVNAKAEADTLKRQALEAASTNFVDLYSVVRAPISVLDDAVAAVQQFFFKIDTVKRVVSNVAAFKRQLIALQNAPKALVNDGKELANAVLDLLTFGTYPTEGEVEINADNFLDQFREQEQFFEFDGTPEEPTGTDTPTAQINNLVQITAVITASGMIAEGEFKTYEDAKQTVDLIVLQIDRLLDSGLADSVHQAIRAQRRSIINDLNTRSTTLNRLADKVLPQSMPVIVISNELYGNVQGEEDIINRNNIVHPGFADGQTILKVISSDA
jgi:prophage DNA circulation protein